MNEEARVLVALGVPATQVDAVRADPECRPVINEVMAILNTTVVNLNACLEEAL